MNIRTKWLPHKEEVITKNGLVTAMQPQCAEAGLEILRQGGNAIDAGVTIGFCNTVVEPYSAGLAGQGILLIYLSREDITISIDFNTRSPANATPDMYKITGVSLKSNNIFDVENDEMRRGAKSVTVPATVAGLCIAHDLYGTLPLKRVLEPAIKFAINGFEASWYTTLFIANNMQKIQSYPSLAEMWLPNGRVPKSWPPPGDKIIQHDLGRLLKKIAHKGPDILYTGKVADAIVKEVRKGGGILSKEDLSNYKPRIGNPMVVSYRDYKIMTVPAPIGSQTVMQTLNILENYDLKSLGHNTPEYLHIFIECARHAFADRFRYLGDWDVASVPIQGLLSKEYAREIATQVDPEKARLEKKLDQEPWAFYLERAIHDPWKYDPKLRPAPTRGFAATPAGGAEGTTHFNVVDKDRNIVCCTHFGGFGRASTPPKSGVYLTGLMGQLIPIPGHPNSVEGWKRPLTNDAPLIVLKNGKPILCLGAPGGRKIINRVTQVVLNIIEFDMNIQNAIAQPTVDASSSLTLIDSRLSVNVINKLQEMGHNIKVIDEEPGMTGNFARPSGIFIDVNTNLLHGGVDVFRPTIALGY